MIPSPIEKNLSLPHKLREREKKFLDIASAAVPSSNSGSPPPPKPQSSGKGLLVAGLRIFYLLYFPNPSGLTILSSLSLPSIFSLPKGSKPLVVLHGQYGPHLQALSGRGNKNQKSKKTTSGCFSSNELVSGSSARGQMTACASRHLTDKGGNTESPAS